MTTNLPHARHWRRAALALLVLPGGCTTVEPIQPANGDFLFEVQAREGAPDACQLGNGKARDCLQPKPDPSLYYAGLGEAIWEADLQRHEYTRLSAERVNNAALYNTMLWPVGAYVAARTLVDPSTSLVRDAGAFALAAYGVLGSGVPERDRLYLESARRLACAIALAAPDLYTPADLEGSQDPNAPRTLRRHQPDLLAVQQRLADALTAYETGRDKLTFQLELEPPPRRTERLTAAEQRLASVRGAGGGAAPLRRSGIALFASRTQIQIDEARKLEALLDRLPDAVAGSRTRLIHRTGQVRRQLNEALITRAPALRAPDTVASDIGKMLAGFAAALAASAPASGADGGKALAQSGRSDAADDPKGLQSLTAASRKLLADFEDSKGEALRRAVREARTWQQRHERRHQDAREMAATSACNGVFDGKALLAATPAASQATP